MKLTWNLKTKLITLFIAVGVIPMVVASFMSYRSARHEIEDQAFERMHMVGSDKAHSIQNYFKLEDKALKDYADLPLTQAALAEFSSAFADYTSSPPSDEHKKKVDEFYRNEFVRTYLEKNPKESISGSSLISLMSGATIEAQYDYIANNPNPLGSKDALTTPSRTNRYSTVHENYHKTMRAYLKRHGLYDVFLVNTKGDVVYTVFKETDFATNLANGPFAESGLSHAFNSALKLAEGESHFEDFNRYTPSYEAAAAFLSTPVFKNGTLIGAMIIQLPTDKINEIVGDREGLGKSGQTLIVGSDGKLRADAIVQKETYNVANSFAKDSTVKIESQALELAKTDKKGNLEFVNYAGINVVAYYAPINILDQTWYIQTEMSADEIFAGLIQLEYSMLIVGIISLLATIAVAWFTGGNIATRLGVVIARLGKSNDQVASASVESASAATELSEAATEQAASLQETMASIEEISAMVSQNAESASKAKSTVEDNNKVSNDGKTSVTEMIKAIGEIKNTNDQILGQMESSNKEFGEIVKIISNIGEKTKVINDIVFQTKLLSFNASVEAARAGEHGKGFAVVAEEVGNLAQMSGNAAREISDMLSESIKKVNDIVDQTTSKVDQLVEVGKDKISMGQATADRCREALDKITANAQAVSMMVTEIANASREQSQGVQEINKAISQLDQVTQQNSAVAQQSSAQAESLSSEAQALSLAVTELVAFVDGSSGSEKSNDSKMQEPSSKNVIPMVSSKSKGPTVVTEKKRAQMAKTTQKAANGDETPSSDDPNFEEF